MVCVPKDEDGGKHVVQQNNRSLAPAVSTRSKTVHRATHSSPNAYNFFIAPTHWAVHSLQLVDCYINYVLCERGFAKLWWSAHTHSQKCCSHYLLARSRLDSISFIYFPAGKWRVVLVQNVLSSIFIFWYTNHGSRWL